VQNLDHLGIIAGLVDELEIVEQINQHLGEDPRERISPGVAVKAMILNGLGLVAALGSAAPAPISITYGYSRDRRPDLK
jgi:transposase